jgi:hypothetical protein
MKKLFIFFVVLCMAAPVMAADWNFYGSERLGTYSVHHDTDTSGLNSSTTNTKWDQNGVGRIGATVKVNDQVGAQFELGIGSTVYQRLLFGTYTFGNGARLLIGQDYTPTALFLANQVYAGDGDMLGAGEYFDNRKPQIRLSISGFQVALIQPYTSADVVDPAGTSASANYVIKSTFPKIEAAYEIKTDQFWTKFFGGYQTYDLDGNAAGVDDLTVSSYIVGLGGEINFGPLYIHAGGHYGQNLGNFGFQGPYTTGDPINGGSDAGLLNTVMVVNANKEKDTTGYGLLGVVGFNASDMLTIEAGGGYEYGERDLSNTDGSSLYEVYLNATIHIAPGFMVVPEIGYVKADGETYGASNDPNPSTTYFGAKWQIDF